jgi:mRNA-degrading endonuclease RelE of RelBE toxin-antitoxin system
MIFIETSIFTKKIKSLLPDEEYRKIQLILVFRPEAGNIIKGSGGLRKIQWKMPGEGKRGGLRMIYYFDPPETIYMLLPYKKTTQDDLSPQQLRILKNLMEEWL